MMNARDHSTKTIVSMELWACVILMIVGAMGCNGPIPRCVAPPEQPKPPVPQYLVVWYSSASVAEQPANSQVSLTATYQKERANIQTAAIRLQE